MDKSFFRLLCGVCCGFFFMTGCWLRIDPMHPLIRSDVLRDEAHIEEIVSKAKLVWAADGKTRVLFVRGTPYERGYQQGVLLRKEIQDNVGYMFREASRKFHAEELFDESYERMRPFIPQEYIDEMHGLAHGSRMPLRVIHGFHALPSMTEWGGKKKIVELAKKQFWGELGTSCSNFAMSPETTKDKEFYTVRILDWGLHRISKIHKYPLITVNVPEKGLASANISWVGFLGAVSGMNEAGITLGEMGYGNPEGETMAGMPMPFMLRDVLTKADNLARVREIVSGSPGDCSYIYLMSDGKSKESELYIRDKDRFLVFKPNERIVDRNNNVTPLPGYSYGGHYLPIMEQNLRERRGSITLESLKSELIPQFAMPSNFQNVIYDPAHLRFWVSNATSPRKRAAEQPYLEFDLGSELNRYRSEKGIQ
jgi:isopenicillin-N N-acyltransferase-like protein